jgi:hypothetical protein
MFNVDDVMLLQLDTRNSSDANQKEQRPKAPAKQRHKRSLRREERVLVKENKIHADEEDQAQQRREIKQDRKRREHLILWLQELYAGHKNVHLYTTNELQTIGRETIERVIALSSCPRLLL